jgi:uncharacterized protein (DUF697 family)
MKLNLFRSVRRQPDTGWTLVPSTPREIDALRRKCRRLVTRRAAMSAGAAAVPIPGLDIAADITLLMRLIEEINAEFGLTPEQIERLQPKAKIIVYQAIVGVGSTVAGKVVTRELAGLLLKKVGMKTAVKYSAKMVPVAGQIASAAIGFAAFRVIGYQHVEACARVAEELIAADAKVV